MKLAAIALGGLLTVLSTGGEACQTGGQLQHPAQGEIYRKFGYAKHPLLKTVRLHAGLDYRGAAGEPVSAAEAGTIVAAGVEDGYGNYIRIDHGNGLQTAYGHLSSLNVTAGQCVSKGELIGNAGNTGVSSQPHLHFEVIQNGRFTNPGPMLPGRS
jgi:murein DD-endopeptidase MepM/ murein hydrolase activator NlpD